MWFLKRLFPHPLVKAIRKGDGKAGLDYVRFFLNRGANPNPTGPDYANPLFQAILGFKHAEVAELLLQCGADPNYADEEGKTALHYLAEFGAFLIEHGAVGAAVAAGREGSMSSDGQQGTGGDEPVVEGLPLESGKPDYILATGVDWGYGKDERGENS